MPDAPPLSPDRLLRFATANLPRYTSYPTAPHFAPLAEQEWRERLGAVAPGDALSLYVHVPFCRALCWYCGCHTAVTRNPLRLARYAAALRAEAALLAEALPAACGPVTALHFGGGTPTAIGVPALVGLVADLRQRFGFAAGAELAIELDPRALGAADADALAAAGFRRASLGVQDIAPEVQARIGREQPAALVEAAVRRLRAAGIARINCDLIYGLPGQTADHVAASAAFVAALGADRVAVFGYAHVPWMKPHQQALDEAALPGPLARLEQAEAAERVLRAAGYEPIGLDHFARPDDPMAEAARAGRLRRNFQGYTTDDAPVLLGLGASAISRLPAFYAQNASDERRWLDLVGAGRLPVARGLALTPEDLERARLIERVMCDLALDLTGVPDAIMATAAARLAPLAGDGLVRLEQGGRWLRVTERGRRFLRHVAACFDARLDPGGAAASRRRHSLAV
ncbi:oxygen-independent coproporphyrinogen III oxidase [Caldovatus aquaticus]|uniref:Coproporphyrinogen-III oxidase n=1 Tax=Caldovatus aquaticus TaxID=2865671 RepID=A0ABS7F4T9_9PROT|nr:oxygen-independent coproporphyrinogen III oxidase [Caldovatus aquaticus]MBW8270584.1 oxygen-independent coproporphyrinogen III oxidase [Caldovatus aquaticus]